MHFQILVCSYCCLIYVFFFQNLNAIDKRFFKFFVTIDPILYFLFLWGPDDLKQKLLTFVNLS